jgi:hypothetical protein
MAEGRSIKRAIAAAIIKARMGPHFDYDVIPKS